MCAPNIALWHKLACNNIGRWKKVKTSLANLKLGQKGRILSLNQSSLRLRLQELGFIPGTTVCCVLKKKKGISAYFVRGACIALRQKDSQNIFVIAEKS